MAKCIDAGKTLDKSRAIGKQIKKVKKVLHIQFSELNMCYEYSENCKWKNTL